MDVPLFSDLGYPGLAIIFLGGGGGGVILCSTFVKVRSRAKMSGSDELRDHQRVTQSVQLRLAAHPRFERFTAKALAHDEDVAESSCNECRISASLELHKIIACADKKPRRM